MGKHIVQPQIDLPKAFSVRDKHEFYPIQHLMARLNPELALTQVGAAVHVNGGCTVFFGVSSTWRANRPAGKMWRTLRQRRGSILRATS
jgi:hypothetical protein